MRVLLRDYEGKGLPLAPLLAAAGHELVAHPPYELLLIDTDLAGPGQRAELIRQATRNRARTVVYPAGPGYPDCAYDGLGTPDPATRLMLVNGPAHLELHRRLGHSRPVRAVGWFMCPQLPLRPTPVKRVLFAPMHPRINGVTIKSADQELNRRVYQRLLNSGVELTVRYIGDQAANGLHPHPNSALVQGDRANPAEQLAQIDAHDLVVATSTFACLALARGKPVIMFGQDLPLLSDDGSRPAANFKVYHDLIRYPLDIEDAPFDSLAGRACAGEGQQWRHDFLGEQTTPARLREALAGLEPSQKPGANGRRKKARAR